jgi:hypothetical protein
VNALRVIKCEHEQLPQKISTLIPDRWLNKLETFH